MFKWPLRYYVYAFCLIVLFAVLVHLEYGTFRFKAVLYPALWITMGIIGVRLLRDRKNKGIIVKLIIVFSIYILLTCGFLCRLMICRTGRDLPLYVHKKNASLTIVCRSFECYMTSGPCDLYKCRQLIGGLKWTVEMPRDEVDMEEWERIRR